jgi:hypothetical protein
MQVGSDPRWQFWNRRLLTIEDEEGEGIWDEKWDKARRKQIEAELGHSVYMTEYMNCPVGEGDRLLTMDEQTCQYQLIGESGGLIDPKEYAPGQNPFSWTHKVEWHDKVEDEQESGDTKIVKQSASFSEILPKMHRFITVDPKHQQGPDTDYACIAVSGLDGQNRLWSLDLFLGRVMTDGLLRIMWEMAYRWRVRIIGIEAVSLQQTIADQAAGMRESMMEQHGWVPHVLPIRYPGGVTKGDRIGGSEWRFNQGRVKLPLHRRESWPYNQLYAQVEDFTYDLSMLRFDDAIDTAIGMVPYVVKAPAVSDIQVQPEIRSPGEAILAGDLFDPVGLRNLEALNGRT